MEGKVDIQKLHNLIKDIQNENWKAYTNFVKSGNMAKYNQDMDGIVSEICNFTDKDVAIVVKEANDFFICGWSIVVRKMLISMRKEGGQN
ncbi:hypothetical protein MCI89_14140 [Muricomes sp. OA1]|uniref:hypothetical protein n=1 Tax=Lachnospiraceae TaxID=186803 RepID=UPI001F064904|nr:hypothetical protein [Muricomes sp. OA1]MBS6765601.1 hypothetical protein [Clostridium sp.]MCH1973484.1 hypothetical protein [Muricomes sp. OA1]